MISGIAGRARLGPGSEQPVDIRLQIPLGAHAHDLSRDFTGLEKQQRWDGPHTIFGGQRLFLVNINFANAETAVVLARQFVQEGCDHFARSAPLGPEINHHGAGDAEDLFGEICLSQFLYGLRGHIHWFQRINWERCL